MSLDSARIIGSLAGMLSVFSFCPQAVRVWRTRHTADLSLSTFVLLVLQAAAWMTYGMLLSDPPLIWTNVCVLALTLAILVAKLRFGVRPRTTA